ncbi:hypothetical protein H4R22_002001 [Coemansia sp. RSA 1290]|nr:hypothetical protein H4R22_002001 [Coemansia sp. RSA 1290]
MSKIPRFGLFGSKPTLGPSPLAKADTATNKDENGSLLDDKPETDDTPVTEPNKEQPLEPPQPSSTEPGKQNQTKRKNAATKPRARPETNAFPPRKRQRRQPVTESSGLKQLYSKYEKQHEIFTKHKKLMNKAAFQMHQTVLMIMQLKKESDASPELTTKSTFKLDEMEDSDSQSLPDPTEILKEEA